MAFKSTLGLIAGVSLISLSSGEGWAREAVFLGYDIESNLARGKFVSKDVEDQDIPGTPLPGAILVTNEGSVEDLNTQLNQMVVDQTNENKFFKPAIDMEPQEFEHYVKMAQHAYANKMASREHAEFMAGKAVRTFSGKFGGLKDEGVQAHAGTVVLDKDDTIVVSYRGSGKPNEAPEDWLTNGRISQTSADRLGLKGQVHEGFFRAAESSLDQVKAHIEAIAQEKGKSVQDFKIVVTGHSLGAAQAQIAAALLKQDLKIADNSGQIQVVTLGSPRWACQEAAADYEAKIGAHNSLRLVVYGDPVPAILMFGYKHAGQYIEISPARTFMGLIGGEVIAAVLNPIHLPLAQQAMMMNPAAGLYFLAAEMATHVGWACWTAVKKTPLELHKADSYVKGAAQALKDHKEDPQGKKTIRAKFAAFKERMSSIFRPIVNFFKPIVGFCSKAVKSVVGVVGKTVDVAHQNTPEPVKQVVRDHGGKVTEPFFKSLKEKVFGKKKSEVTVAVSL